MRASNPLVFERKEYVDWRHVNMFRALGPFIE